MTNYRRYAEERKCKICGEIFKPRYSAFNRPEKYCSNECFKRGVAQTTNNHLKRKLKEDPSFKFHQYVRSVLSNALIGKNEWSESTWNERMGYDIDQLKRNIEAKWKENISWENYGEWNIDHIVPMTFFECEKYSDPAFMACWSLENLQPLWLADNSKKSNILQISALSKVPLILSMKTGILQIYYNHKGRKIKLNHGRNIDKKFKEIAKRAFSTKNIVISLHN